MRRSVLLRFTGLATASLVQALSYVVLARTLGAAGFGSFSWLLSAGLLLISLTGFGFTHRMLRTPVGEEGDGLRSLAVMTRLVMATLIGIVLAIVGVSLGVGTSVVTVAVAFLTIEAVTDLCQAALAGQRRIGYATVLLVIQRTAALGAVVSTLWTVIPFVFVAGAIVMANAVSVLRRRPRMRGLSAAISSSRGFWAANLAASISQAEIPIITAAGGASMAGIYAGGVRAASPINLLSQALLHVSTPELTRIENEARWELFRRMHTVTLWVIAGAVVMAVPVGFAVAWLLGPGFEVAWATAAGFVLGGAIMGANQAHQALLLALGRPGLSARAVAVGAVAGVVSAAILATTVALPWLGLVPVITQGTMYLLFRRTVTRLHT